MAEKNFNTLSLIAIVAIVGIVGLILMARSGTSSVPSTESSGAATRQIVERATDEIQTISWEEEDGSITQISMRAGGDTACIGSYWCYGSGCTVTNIQGCISLPDHIGGCSNEYCTCTGLECSECQHNCISRPAAGQSAMS